ncbi:MAG: acyl-CoA oxidase [Gemmatimonadetes bacterium]|nr:acyl-CoA oxidase [Gemmatimonadota bacterium]NIR76827.1 acyl-CoA oxidase [Gemmatimonadota bacterium]NIT85346.1 acyl-CoA oxidase [Gemmatimonadota bacterium]NIU29166.1 acyl-CoA oxidase [Gemmatimonadota bacterium]NIU34265.1 acyl-CoA oxidase [Gemmatimonadota bacterium]
MTPDSSGPSTEAPSAGASSGRLSSPPIPEDRLDLVPFLPMIYVAWADGVLTPGEIQRICDRIEGAEWLDEEGREILSAWLRPDAPPTPKALAKLEERIRERARELPERAGRSLAELGLEIAGGGGSGEAWESGRARRALEEMEGDVGVAPSEAVRDLLGLRPEPGPAEPAPGALDPEAISRYLDGEHRALRRAVLDLLARDEMRTPLEIGRAEHRARVLEGLRVLADEGYGLLAFPEAYGGRGDPGAMIAAFETLAFGDLSVLVKFGVQFGLFGGSVHQLGTRRHHERWLEAIGRLQVAGCYAMTERGHGSNVRELETTATYDPGDEAFVVHTPTASARKDWAGNAALHGRVATVFARLVAQGEDHGVHAFLVPIRDDEGRPAPGVEIEDCGPKVGLDGVDNGRIAFDRVRIPRENLLDRFGEVSPEGDYTSPIPSPGKRFFTMLRTLVGGRISVAAASVSAAKTALSIAVPYSEGRRQFGRAGGAEVPILDYLVHQRLLLPRLATTYGLHFAVRRLARRYASGYAAGAEGEGEVEVRAAGLKAYASRHAMETIQACREACGGRGYLAENRLGRLRHDADVFTTFEGANPVLLQLVARGLLSDFREEMGDLRLWDIVRHVAERASTSLAELNPVVVRRTDEEHLRDPEFHEAALRYREQRLLTTVARRLQARIEEGEDTFHAMNACQDHLVTLARAHVERVVLEAFHEGVSGAPDEEVSEALRTLAALFAASRLEANRAWFLESGYVEPGKSKAVRALVNLLCGEVRAHAGSLTRGFGIPPAVLSAPAAEGP